MNGKININKMRSTTPIVLIYTLVVMICYVLPVLKYSISYIPLAILLLIVYLFCLQQGKIEVEPYVQMMLCVLMTAILTVLVCQPGNFAEGFNELIRGLRFFAPAALYLVINKKENGYYFTLRVVKFVGLLLFIFVAVQTLIAIQEDPMIARMLAYGEGISKDVEAYRFRNVGGFEFSYAIGFVAVISLYMTVPTKKVGKKVCWGILYVFTMFYVIQAQYMTLLILTVIFSVIVIYQITKRTPFTFFVVVGCGIAVIMLPVLVNYWGANISGEMLAYKFETFNDFFNAGNLTALGERPKYLWEAFLRFLQSPIWGNTIIENGNVMKEYNEVHSSFFGYLQNMGLVGWACFYAPLFIMAKKIKETIQKQKSKNIYGTIVGMFVILSILNPINYAFEICFVVFLIIPCVLRCMDGEGE